VNRYGIVHSPSQVGEVFGEVYGKQYSKASISRMIEYLRADVQQWLSRSLETYYPIIFVDAIHVKVHRKRSVENEAFYVVLGVKEDKSREVPGIFNRPSESATGWREMFVSLEHRGIKSIGLLVADGIKYLEDSLTEVFPGTPLQKCVTHLKRNMLARVRHGDKGVMAEDLRDIFRTGDPHYTPEQGWEAWQAFCGKWGEDYRGIKKLGNDPFYRYYFTYLNYHPKVQSMIYTTNWIERLQRDFRRVLRMRGAMPTEESVIVLMAKTAMGKKAYFRALPGIERDKVLFPDDSGNFLDLLNNS
jgi:putative transposase